MNFVYYCAFVIASHLISKPVAFRSCAFKSEYRKWSSSWKKNGKRIVSNFFLAILHKLHFISKALHSFNWIFAVDLVYDFQPLFAIYFSLTSMKKYIFDKREEKRKKERKKPRKKYNAIATMSPCIFHIEFIAIRWIEYISQSRFHHTKNVAGEPIRKKAAFKLSIVSIEFFSRKKT